MAKAATILLAAGVVIFVFSAPLAAAQHGTLRVCVRNDALVADDTLDEARRVVTDIYSQAGLTLLWCADDCTVTIALRPRSRHCATCERCDGLHTGRRRRARAAGVCADQPGESNCRWIQHCKVDRAWHRHGARAGPSAHLQGAHPDGNHEGLLQSIRFPKSATGRTASDLRASSAHSALNQRSCSTESRRQRHSKRLETSECTMDKGRASDTHRPIPRSRRNLRSLESRRPVQEHVDRRRRLQC